MMRMRMWSAHFKLAAFAGTSKNLKSLTAGPTVAGASTQALVHVCPAAQRRTLS